MALEIIRKENRSAAELQQAFNILFKNDKTITETFKYSDIKDFNKILDNLRLLSKTRLMLHRYCPFKFRMQYIMQQYSDEFKQIMIDGKNLHLTNQRFWKETVTVTDFMNATNLEKMMYYNYKKLIPYSERTPFIEEMIKSFIWFESRRINQIYDELGKSKDVIQNYVMPVALELPIENWDNNLMGIIDRIDRTTNNCYAVIEYKYGKPKTMESVYDKQAIQTELGFYGLLVGGDKCYVVNDKSTLVPIKEYLGFKPEFYYGAMLFFQDIANTNELFKINTQILREADRKIKAFWSALDTGWFKPKRNISCTKVCEFYWDICELNNEWLDLDRIVYNNPEEKGNYNIQTPKQTVLDELDLDDENGEDIE